MNFTSTIVGTLSGTLTLSGSVVFEGTLEEMISSYATNNVKLLTADFNGINGYVLFIPERTVFDVPELVMIISAHDGVTNHGNSGFTVSDQAMFGNNTQEFIQTNVASQPDISLESNGINVWIMTGSQSLSVSDPAASDLSWATQGMYSGWFYWNGQGDDTVFSCRNGAGYRIAMGINGALGLNVWTDGTTCVYSSSILTPNSWHYYECVVDCEQSTPSDRLRLSINRQLKSPISIVGSDWPTSLPVSPTSFEIGINYDDNYWHGKMANFNVCDGIPSDGDRNLIANHRSPITSSF